MTSRFNKAIRAVCLQEMEIHRLRDALAERDKAVQALKRQLEESNPQTRMDIEIVEAERPE